MAIGFMVFLCLLAVMAWMKLFCSHKDAAFSYGLLGHVCVGLGGSQHLADFYPDLVHSQWRESLPFLPQFLQVFLSNSGHVEIEWPSWQQ
jgi:hypothetical protein